MTRKHFVALAVEFGEAWRQFDIDAAAGDVDFCRIDAMGDTLIDAQTRVMGVCKRSNPRFDREHFSQFVEEIRNYQRDLDGRKIPAAKQRAAAGVTR